MTPDETTDFFQDQKVRKIKTVKMIGDTILQTIINNLTNTLSHFESIVSWDSKELALHRELEAHMRNETLTQDILNRMFSQLDQHRKELNKYNQKLMAMQTQDTKGKPADA